MRSQIRAALPLILVGAIIALFPFAETLWKRYNPVTGAWPDGNITYYNASEYEMSLRAAFRRWEEVGVPVRFREVGNRESADLVIYSGKEGLREHCGNDDCTGWATIGHSPFRKAEMWLLPPSNPYERDIQDFVMMPTIIHEVGHVLGLGHNNEMCSIMNVRDSACRAMSRPRITSTGRSMLCGPWERDLEDLREIYPEVGTSFSGFCQDPRANWDFFVARSQGVLAGLREFQRDYNR